MLFRKLKNYTIVIKEIFLCQRIFTTQIRICFIIIKDHTFVTLGFLAYGVDFEKTFV